MKEWSKKKDGDGDGVEIVLTYNSKFCTPPVSPPPFFPPTYKFYRGTFYLFSIVLGLTLNDVNQSVHSFVRLSQPKSPHTPSSTKKKREREGGRN